MNFGLNFGPIEQAVGTEFFTYALPWLLTFAIVYGLLEHYEIPKDKSARAVISLVLAFLVLPAAAPIMSVLTEMGLGLVILFCGILFFLILLELTGTKHREIEEKEGKRGEKVKIISRGSERIHERHTKSFGIIVIILALLIFIGSGGMELIGIEIPNVNMPLLFFIGIMVLAVWWMAKE